MAAIYMWPLDYQVILTTTLYPVDANDGVLLAATISGGYMNLLPYDEVQTANEDMWYAEYIQTRWFYEDGPYDDFVNTFDENILSSVYTQTRWFYEDGPYDDFVNTFDEDLLDIQYLLKGVFADAPEEMLQLSATITTNCDMGLI